jgi:hypothetical protein
MIDPQTVHDSLSNKTEHEAVGMFEDFRQLHVNSGEFADVKKPPIINVVCCNAEIRRTPVLLANQVIQESPAFWLPLDPMESLHGGFQRCAHVISFAEQLRQLALEFGHPAGSLRTLLLDGREFIPLFF